MNERNLYLNGTYELAVQRGYDLLQLKLDGWWCRAVFESGVAHYHSETGRQFDTSHSFDLDGCVLIGEFMRGTQWSQQPQHKGRFYVYDIWSIFGEPITTESYSARFRLLRKLNLPSVFSLVDCFRIGDFDSVWNRYIMREGYEGVVFRKSTSTREDAIMRCKREYSLDGIVTGFKPGLGKYADTLGAVQVTLPTGTTTDVGGGFTDAERDEIWREQSRFLGRVMEFTANAIFESGAPRHPRFVRWREDKR